MDMDKTAAYIAAKRKEKNLTQARLAAELNISDKTVSKWETAKGMPDIAIISDLCAALDISPTEFFNGEDMATDGTGNSDRIIIQVADRYQRMGRKRMFCFFTFIISMLIVSVCSFFGDGFPKIVTLVTAYIVSAIAAYKLGNISSTDIKQLQKVALILLIFMTIVTVSLGRNYFTAANLPEYERLSVSTHFAWLIFGDYNWSVHRFLMGFKNSVAAVALLAGQNLYLLSARLKNK